MVEYYATTRPAVADRLRNTAAASTSPTGRSLEALKAPWKSLGGSWRGRRARRRRARVEPAAISEETTSRLAEPVDVLWPASDRLWRGAAESGHWEDAVSVGIGDGGNEVGLGRVPSSPPSALIAWRGLLRAGRERRRGPRPPLVATVSNWAAPLRAAARAFPAALDDGAGVARAVLEARSAGSVAGKS